MSSLTSSLDAACTVPDLLQRRERDGAERVFCTFQGRVLTFAGLCQGVREMAGALVAYGVEPGHRVGYMMPSSLEHIELYLAASWAGACAVPFSIHLKADGLELQMRSSRPEVMVASRAYRVTLEDALSRIESPPRVMWLEDGPTSPGRSSLGEQRRSARGMNTPHARSLNDPIAISYTSGTTGAPKGVVMSERFYWVGAKNAGILSGAGPQDTYFMWEPFYHVAAWMTVLMALQHGLRIHMVERFSASRLWEEIASGGANKFHYLGGLINIILSQPTVPAERDNTLEVAWGAACPAHSWRAFEERFGVQIREGYGISEGQNFTHMNMRGVVGSIGTAAPEFESWIADDEGQRLPPGSIGEIVLRPREPGVTMSGYFGQEAQTREVLRSDGCVYTGDTGYVDSQGFFYFKGRKKDALRRRGENVSAWEVERVINAAPGVEESAVIGVDAAIGEQDILALVKLEQGADLDALALLEFCASRLAHYQVPRFVIQVEEFPRGPTQRIRKAEIQVDLSQAFDAEAAGWRPPRQT